MGTYTELHYNVELNKDVPKEIIEILKYMLGDIKEKPDVSDILLFKCERWETMLRTDSYYFESQTQSQLIFDEDNDIYLGVCCNLKNYTNEIEHFLNWIMPYVYTEGFLGFYRNENRADPILIYSGFKRYAVNSEQDFNGLKVELNIYKKNIKDHDEGSEADCICLQNNIDIDLDKEIT